MSDSYWQTLCDRILSGLFVAGQPAPAAQAVFDAYPFGARQYHPYKVWCKRVRAWQAAHAAGLASPIDPPRGKRAREKRSDDGSGDLFEGAA